MTDELDFLCDDDAFEPYTYMNAPMMEFSQQMNSNMFVPTTTTAPVETATTITTSTTPSTKDSSLKKSKKSKSSSSSSSKNTSSSSTNATTTTTTATASTSNSLERKKKKDKSSHHKGDETMQCSGVPTQAVQTLDQAHFSVASEIPDTSYSLSLHIMENGSVENTSKWVKSNSKMLTELFSKPIGDIVIASPNAEHLASVPPKKSSSLKKEPVHESVESSQHEHKPSKSSKSKTSSSSSSSSSKKTHRSSASTDMTPTTISQPQQQPQQQQQPQPQQQPQQFSFTNLQQPSTPFNQFEMFSSPLCAKAEELELKQEDLTSEDSSLSITSQSKLTEEELESKRQFHLVCEQNRRKHIKDGLEELKNSLPSCENQKMTKAAILSKAVAYVQHSKRQKEYLTAQIQALRQEVHRLQLSCQCHNHQNDINFVPCIPPNPTFLKQQEKLQEYLPIQPKTSPQLSQPVQKGLKHPHSSFVQPQTNQTEPPPPYSLPRHNNLLSVPSDMQFRNTSSPSSSVDGDSDTRSLASFEEVEPLPTGWQELMTPDGKTFYLNQKAGLSSWVDPRHNNAINLSRSKNRPKSFHSVGGIDHIPASPQWGSTMSLPESMIRDISGLQFNQPMDSEMSDVKPRIHGLGVDVHCFGNN